MSWPRLECSEPTDTSPPDLPEDFWHALVLALLNEAPSSRHELRDQLCRMGVPDNGHGVERALRELEHRGLVYAGDDAAMRCSAGTYRLTRDGSERLGDAVLDLRGTEVLLGRFLARCAERLVTDTRREPA